MSGAAYQGAEDCAGWCSGVHSRANAGLGQDPKGRANDTGMRPRTLARYGDTKYLCGTRMLVRRCAAHPGAHARRRTSRLVSRPAMPCLRTLSRTRRSSIAR